MSQEIGPEFNKQRTTHEIEAGPEFKPELEPKLKRKNPRSFRPIFLIPWSLILLSGLTFMFGDEIGLIQALNIVMYFVAALCLVIGTLLAAYLDSNRYVSSISFKKFPHLEAK